MREKSKRARGAGCMNGAVIAHTEHITIEEREANDNRYFVVWVKTKRERGYNKFFTLSAAFQFARDMVLENRQQAIRKEGRPA